MYEFIVVLELCYEDNPVLALGEGHLCGHLLNLR